jgi:hypothetical protein
MMRAMTLRLLVAAAAATLSLAACTGSNEPAPRRSRPPAGAAAQPVGVYSYETKGFERLSAVFSSAHRYPRLSTVAVARSACGFNERWVPRAERSSESRFCLKPNRWRLDALVDYHEFFGQAVRQQFACKGPFVPRPPVVRTGFRWTDRCRGAGSRVTVHYEAVREQPLEVAGRPVTTIFIRARAELRGRINGINRIDSWLSRRNGLLVRRNVRSNTAVDSPFGRIRDRERYVLKLKSLSPP